MIEELVEKLIELAEKWGKEAGVASMGVYGNPINPELQELKKLVVVERHAGRREALLEVADMLFVGSEAVNKVSAAYYQAYQDGKAK